MQTSETKFSILSHACLLLERGNTKIIIDPWLLGACYWGSWWNFPQPVIDRDLLSRVDYVIISHVHWDHWHGLTLKKLFKGCQFIVPDEYQKRSARDLRNIKIGDVREVKHAHTLELTDNIKITCYNFGLFLNDAAIVIETPECRILDANDCKITGLPLQHILKKHGHFDFSLRSHSSANYRACIKSEDSFATDDPEHYARSFRLFMQRARPTYAVPFASNSCHLHQDTVHYNHLVTNPMLLKAQLGDHPFQSTKLKIMLPGSSWSSETGFFLAPTDCFNDVEAHLKSYQYEKSAILERLYAKERSLSLDQRLLDRHCKHIKSIPKWVRKRINQDIAYCIRHIDGDKQYFKLNLAAATLTACNESSYQAAQIRFEWPLQVFRDAVYKKMYHHAFISKRVSFYIPSQAQASTLNRMILLLELIELDVFPLKFSYFAKITKSYLVRYRELIVYFSAFYYAKIKKLPMYLVEEKISQRKS